MIKKERLTGYLTAILFFLISLGIEILLQNTGNFSYESIYFLSFISIVTAATYGGWEPGLLATVLSTIAVSYSLIYSPVNLGQIWIFLGGTLISILIGRIKNSERNALETSELSIKNELYLRGVLDSLFIFVGVLTPKGILLETNKASVEAAKLTFDQVINKKIKNTYWWSYSKQSRLKIMRSLKNACTGESVRYDTLMRVVDGKLIMVDFSMRPLRDREGRVKYIVMLAVDIDKRTETLNDNVKLYRELKKQKKITDNIIANIPGVVWELSRKSDREDYKLNFVSDYEETMLGHKIGICQEDINFWKKIIHQDDIKRIFREIDWVYHKQKQKLCQFRCLKADGKYIWVESRFIANTDDEGNSVGVEGVLLDITDRVKAEKIKEEFLSIANHEIKTPLTTIKAFTQIIDKKIKIFDWQGVADYLKKMNIYIDRLNRLISEFMDFTRIETGKLEYFDEIFNIDKLIRDVVADIQLTNEDHLIEIRGQSNKNILGDKNRISQVLINLINNGVKYSPKSNKIIVEINEEPNLVIVGVKDFGTGISKISQKKIFEKFYRINETKNIAMGYGLGLYICNEIIKHHNGKIWVESELNKGSTFYFYLPSIN